jgi:hypothetical protein
MSTPRSSDLAPDVDKRRRVTFPTIPAAATATSRVPKTTTTTNGTRIYSKFLLEDLQSQQSHVVLTALRYLSASFVRNNKCQDFCRLGGHGVLSVVMNNWKDHAAIQSLCCDCISRLLHNTYNPNTTENNKDNRLSQAFLDLGLVEFLTGVVERFPHEPTLQYRVTKVLKFLDIKSMIDDHDGIAMVLTLMTKFPLVPSLQELGCRFFQITLQLGFVTAAEIRTTALVPIAKAVQSHPNHLGIQKSVSIIVKRVSR